MDQDHEQPPGQAQQLRSPARRHAAPAGATKASRHKPDKWRALERQAAAEHDQQERSVAQLLAQQQELRLKESMLLLSIEVMGVVAHNMARGPQDYQQGRAAAAPPPLAPPAAQADRLRECEQQIQLMLHASGGGPSSGHEGAHYQRCMAFLHSLFDRERVQKVLDMGVAGMAARLRELSGKCAIMLVQRDHEQLWVPAVEFMRIIMSCMLHDEASFYQLASMDLETQAPYQLRPPEFWRAAARRLHLLPEQVAALKCLQGHVRRRWAATGGSIGRVAQQQDSLIQAQASMLQQQLAPQQAQPLQQELQQQRGQQRPQAAPQRRRRRQQQQQQEPQPPPSAGGPHEQLAAQVKSLQLAQGDVVAQQARNVQQWRALGLQLGIVTIFLLSPAQTASFIAASYPNVPRMDWVLQAVENMDDLQQQQQQYLQQYLLQVQQQQLAGPAQPQLAPGNAGQRSAQQRSTQRQQSRQRRRQPSPARPPPTSRPSSSSGSGSKGMLLSAAAHSAALAARADS